MKAVLRKTLETGEGTPAYDFPLYTKDKRKLMIRLSASAKKDQHGNIIGVQGIGTDVSDEKWKEDEFNRFTAMANAPVICVDADMRVEIWNKFTERITGFSAEEAIGRNIIDVFIDEKNRSSVKSVLEHTLSTGEGHADYEFPLYTKDNRKLMIRLSAS